MKIMHLVVLIWTLDRHHAYPVAELLHVTIQTCKYEVDYLSDQSVCSSLILRDNMAKVDSKGGSYCRKSYQNASESLLVQKSTSKKKTGKPLLNLKTILTRSLSGWNVLLRSQHSIEGKRHRLMKRLIPLQKSTEMRFKKEQKNTAMSDSSGPHLFDVG